MKSFFRQLLCFFGIHKYNCWIGSITTQADEDIEIYSCDCGAKKIY